VLLQLPKQKSPAAITARQWKRVFMAQSSPRTRLRFGPRGWNHARRGGNVPLAVSKFRPVRFAVYLGIPPLCRINANGWTGRELWGTCRESGGRCCQETFCNSCPEKSWETRDGITGAKAYSRGIGRNRPLSLLVSAGQPSLSQETSRCVALWLALFRDFTNDSSACPVLSPLIRRLPAKTKGYRPRGPPWNQIRSEMTIK
jgi:hypothetical protein